MQGYAAKYSARFVIDYGGRLKQPVIAGSFSENIIPVCLFARTSTGEACIVNVIQKSGPGLSV